MLRDGEEAVNGPLNLPSWPMMLLSGVWLSLEGSQPFVQKLALPFPLTHMISAARAVVIEGAGSADVAGRLLVPALFSVIFVFIGSLTFRWNSPGTADGRSRRTLHAPCPGTGAARRGIEQGHGGPFGAIVVIDDRIVGEAWSQPMRLSDTSTSIQVSNFSGKGRLYHSRPYQGTLETNRATDSPPPG